MGGAGYGDDRPTAVVVVSGAGYCYSDISLQRLYHRRDHRCRSGTVGGKTDGVVVGMASEKQKQAWDRYFIKVERRKKMLELYHKGLIDREIAAEVGVSTATVTHWRHRNNLPANGNGGCGFTERCGVSMEKVLDPDQCEIVRQFLGCLLAMQDEYPNRKIDVGVFMREYRGVLRERAG